MENAAMGTLAWYSQSGGQLSVKEKEALARNVAMLRAEIAFDELRTRLGLLSPNRIDLDSLAPPDTALIRDADEFARGFYDEVLWNHCLRTYYFGALVAANDGIAFDREVFYAAAICHDVGANEAKAGSVHTHCFACNGGSLTRDHLHVSGHANVAHRVGDAISSHMNLFVPPSGYAAENVLTAVGATCDIFGAYVRRIHPEILYQAVERWPRTGLMDAFGPFLAAQHLQDSRTAVLVEMGVFESDGEHPVEALLARQGDRGS